MDLAEALKDEGWHLSNDAIQRISNNGALTSVRVLHCKALDLDLREISVPFFPEDIAKGKLDSVPGNVIVQVQKVRNISAPKANEDSQAAPRMLKIVLTDGHTVCHAIEVETVSTLSLNSPPGTKVLLKGELLALSHGLLLLRPACVEVLGGQVTALIDKWELNRSLAKHTRGRIEEGGPPPWIPFGQKINRPNLPDRNFKSLGEAVAKENAEFEAQRQGAIAEAARGGARKVFGGGNKPIRDRNVHSIMNVGFSQEQAEQALKQTRNNVVRALLTLQGKPIGGNGKREERGNRRRGDRDEEGGSGPKPSGQVSLFAFLEDKLPTQNDKEEKENDNQTVSSGFNNYSTGNQRYNNNTSSQRGRPERLQNRSGGRGSQNSGPTEPRRDDRNRSNPLATQHQKPPRFQNQQRYNDSYQSWSYGSNNDYTYDDRSSFNNSRLSRNYEEFNSEPYNRRTQPPPPVFTNSDPPHDYGRNNRRYDLHNNSGPGGGNAGYKNSNANYTRQLLEAGMPEIPEFPFKDASSLPPLLSNTAPAFFHSNNGPAGGPTLQTPPPFHGSNGETPAWQWKIGDKCLAKYWEDNRYYSAEVTGVSKKTCVVRFLEYGNFEEVLQDDCIPATEEPVNHSNQHSNANSTHNPSNNHFSGVLEFRRGGTRPYIKSADSSHRKAQRNSQPMYVPPAQRKD